MKKKLLILAVLLLVSIPAFAESIDAEWVRRYAAPIHCDDSAYAIVSDHSGNVYVTGTSWAGARFTDYATIKYYPNGDTAWVKRYDGPGDGGNDRANAITVDQLGNVYVTGTSWADGTQFDYATIKYYSNGDTAWVRRYSIAGAHDDEAAAITVDGSNYVYVTGSAGTIKYHSDGDTAWVRRYNISATALVVDASGNIFVTGCYEGYGWYATVKLYPNGDSAWEKIYTYGNVESMATSIAIDSLGNVYVTGSSGGVCATIKYNSSGEEQWVKRHGQTGGGNPRVATDVSGNVYACGGFGTIRYNPNDGDTAWVRGYGGYTIAVDNSGYVHVAGSIGDHHGGTDYWTVKLYPNGDSAWGRTYHGPWDYYDIVTAIAIDDSGNTYVTGYSDAFEYGSNGCDYGTVKYDRNGNELWAQTYDYAAPGDVPNGLDEPSDLALDNSGNIYVTGFSFGGPCYEGSNDNRVTIKYYPNGDTAWLRRSEGYGRALAVDKLGNVCVTGSAVGEDYYATIKYYPNGDTAWVKRYCQTAGTYHSANDIAVDNSGNVYVTGSSYWKYATIKYYPNGDTAWVRTYSSGQGLYSSANAIAVDGFGNAYVTGVSRVVETGSDYVTIKYRPNGDTAWVRRYNGIGYGNDSALALVVDDFGNVYVTGYCYGITTGYDYTTIKYDSSGNQLWAKRYDGSNYNLYDAAYAIAVDQSGNVCVTGKSYDQYGGHLYRSDYATIKYYPNGDTAWVRRYNGTGWSHDFATAIAIDDSGSIYVTGVGSDNSFSGFNTTIKYYPNGDTAWVKRYKGGGLDSACAIAVDHSGNVYITAKSYGPGTSFDYATVKYVQTDNDVKDETSSREKPSEFTLSQNYPNPFNQTTKIEFSLARSRFVSLNIYDILGKKVRNLVSENLSSGYKSVFWDGKNDDGKDVASGIYFYQLRIGDFSEVKKLVLLK